MRFPANSWDSSWYVKESGLAFLPEISLVRNRHDKEIHTKKKTLFAEVTAQRSTLYRARVTFISRFHGSLSHLWKRGEKKNTLLAILGNGVHPAIRGDCCVTVFFIVQVSLSNTTMCACVQYGLRECVWCGCEKLLVFEYCSYQGNRPFPSSPPFLPQS